MIHINQNTGNNHNPNEVVFIYWEDSWNVANKNC